MYCVTQSLAGWSSDGPERRWTSFCVSWCAIVFNGSLCVTGMICSLLMSLGLLYRSSLWDQDSERSVGRLSLSHSCSVLL